MSSSAAIPVRMIFWPTCFRTNVVYRRVVILNSTDIVPISEISKKLYCLIFGSLCHYPTSLKKCAHFSVNAYYHLLLRGHSNNTWHSWGGWDGTGLCHLMSHKKGGAEPKCHVIFFHIFELYYFVLWPLTRPLTSLQIWRSTFHALSRINSLLAGLVCFYHQMSQGEEGGV